MLYDRLVVEVEFQKLTTRDDLELILAQLNCHGCQRFEALSRNLKVRFY